jgi:hypothetical protein
LQAKQSVLYTTVKSKQRTAPQFPFHRVLFIEDNTVFLPSTLLSLFLGMNIKMEGRHFDTTEVNAVGAKHPHRTRLLDALKIAKRAGDAA